jgi:hypothetical protein
MDTSDRRGFLAAMARRAAHGARTVAKEAGNPARAITRYVNELDLDPATAAEPAPAGPEPRLEATAPSRCVSIDELCALAAENSLAHHADALRALAVKSIRLTPEAMDGADGWIADAAATWDGEGEVLVAQIALSSVALADTPLAGPGWLRLYVGQPDPASEQSGGLLPARAVIADLPEEAPADARPIATGAELTLPRVWSAPVTELSFDPTERQAYTEVRRRLSETQGVEHDGDGGPRIAYHRVLGYPNETSGGMPAACAVAVGSDPEHAHREWRLLAQISSPGRERLYLWTRSAAIESGELEPVVAFLR